MASVSWLNGTSGNWSDAADWSTGTVPTTSSDVTIGAGGNYTVTLDIPAKVAKFVLSNSGTNFVVDNGLTVTQGTTISAGVVSIARNETMSLAGKSSFGGGNNAATISGSGYLVNNGTLTVADQSSSQSVALENGAVWRNAGTVSDAGLISFDNNTSVIQNEAGGTFDFTSDDGGIGTNNYGTGTFSNAGTLAKTKGTGISHVYVGVTNTGTVSASSGTLEFDAGGSLGGTFTTSGKGLISLRGGTFGVVTRSATIGGYVMVANAALAPGLNNTLTLSGTDIFGSTEYAAYLNGTGTVQTGGALTVADQGATTSVVLENGIVWSNTGTVSDAGAISFNNNGSTLDNTASGTFDLTTNDSDLNTSNYGSGPLTNEGTFAKTGGTGVSNVNVAVINTGTMSASSGTLALNAGGSLGGTFATSGTGLITLSGGTFGIVGTAATLGGSITISNATLAPGLDNTLMLSGTDIFGSAGHTAYLNGLGTVQTSGALTVADQGASASAVLESDVVWSNTGTVNDAGAISFNNDASTLNNTASGTFDLTTNDSDLDTSNYGSGPLTNEGTFAKTGGSGTSNVNIAVINTGTISASSGTLALNAGGSLGGTFATSGTGLISLSGGTFGVVGSAATLGGSTTISNATLAPGRDNTLTLSGTDIFGSTEYAAYLNGLGTVQTSGALTVADQGATTSVVLENGIVWSNTGTVSDAGAISFNNNASTIDNTASGTFDLTTDDSDLNASNYGSGPLTNEGTFAKTGGSGTSNVNVAVINTGTISASSGTLALNAGGSLGGTFATSGTGLITLSGGSFGVVGSAATLGGSITISNATLAPGLGNTLTFSGTDTFGSTGYAAYLNGAGTVQTSGALTVTDQGATASVVLENGIVWSNTGMVNDAGAISFSNNASTLDNAAGATFDLSTDDSDLDSSNYGSGPLTNEGTFAKTGGTGTSAVDVAVVNTGTIYVSTGTLTLASSVTGTGTLEIKGSATLELGETPASTQKIAFQTSKGTLKLDHPATLTQVLTGFGVGDRLDLAGTMVTAASISGDVVTVTVGSTNYTFTSSENLAGDTAAVSSDGNGGSYVTLSAGDAKAHASGPVTAAAKTTLSPSNVRVLDATALGLGKIGFVTAADSAIGVTTDSTDLGATQASVSAYLPWENVANFSWQSVSNRLSGHAGLDHATAIDVGLPASAHPTTSLFDVTDGSSYALSSLGGIHSGVTF